jgi:hypothetical protein
VASVDLVPAAALTIALPPHRGDRLVPEPSPVDRELQALAADLRKLESEYTMYFAGRAPRPPYESRARVEQTIKRLERTPYEAQVHRFQFGAVQARFAAFAELWDRAVRAREEGRPTPFTRQAPGTTGAQAPQPGTVVHTTALSNPVGQLDKLRDLYDALMDARREAGHDPVPFHRFADLVKRQVADLQERYRSEEVSFRVVVQEGKVSFKARPGGGAAPVAPETPPD